MAYKTVLVHCNDKSRMHRLLGPALDVAGPFGAHLVGLSITPPIVVVPAGMPGSPDTIVLDEHCKAYRRDNPEMKAALEAAARARGLDTAWHEAETGSTTVADVALQHARAADLVVASQTAPDWLGSPHLDIADRLVLESGRPVLIVPNAGPQQAIGRKIVVAWNGAREAARAAFDALPLLQHASEVRVVSISPQADGDRPSGVACAEICATLARHGVKCEATEAVERQANAGKALLTLSADWGADLLVMGCYGHSRLREFVFGGATQHVLDHMTIPVLMSH